MRQEGKNAPSNFCLRQEHICPGENEWDFGILRDLDGKSGG